MVEWCLRLQVFSAGAMNDRQGDLAASLFFAANFLLIKQLNALLLPVDSLQNIAIK